jgi:carbonic anhydrase
MSLNTIGGLLERNREHIDAFGEILADHGDGQAPDAVTVCCSDSRVLQGRMWGNPEPGETFTVGNIGNRVRQRTADDTVVSGDVLYPLLHTGTETAIVVGHTGCGAVTATYQALSGVENDAAPGIEACVDLLAEDLEDAHGALPDDLDDEAAVNRLVESNVDRQVDHLRTSGDVPDNVVVVGAVYDLHGAYGGQRGRVAVVNVDGEIDPATIAEDNPEIAEWVDRHWMGV